MREYTINTNDAQTRLDKFLIKTVPALPSSLVQKYIRIKRIKVNGKRAARDQRLNTGDVVSLYINDEFFESSRPTKVDLTQIPQLDILYEDDNIILVNKKPGLSVHEDAQQQSGTLIDQLQAYLYQSGQWDPRRENSFSPALCNRIDRNTGGIVIAAKTASALRIINEKIKNRELTKKYLCIVRGQMQPRDGKIQNYIFKDAVKNQVYVRDHSVPGAKTAITFYRTLAVSWDMSLIECTLVTGRTHQIRAQMAATGHPLLGDGKYGDYQWNKIHHRTHQALYSYQLTFDFKSPAQELDYLKGKTVTITAIDFVKQYFPDVKLFKTLSAFL